MDMKTNADTRPTDFDNRPEYTDNPDVVLQAELAYLKRRKSLSNEDSNQLVGLALSGGGIRSAVFNLGVLQALSRHKLLDKFDYLSTVSGGGYIGTSLTWFLSEKGQNSFREESTSSDAAPFGVSAKNIPFGTDEPGKIIRSADSEFQRDILHHFRSHGNYLWPGDGITPLTFVGAVARGILLSLLVWMPLLCLLMYALISIGTAKPDEVPLVFQIFRESAYYLLIIYTFIAVLYTIFLSKHEELTARTTNFFEVRLSEWLLKIILLLVALYLVSEASNRILATPSSNSFKSDFTVSLALLIGIALSVFFVVTKSSSPVGRIFLNIAAILLIFVLLLLSYQIAHQYHSGNINVPFFSVELKSPIPEILLIASILVGWRSHLGYTNIHRYYRNRLRKAFMPNHEEVFGRSSSNDSDENTLFSYTNIYSFYRNSPIRTLMPNHEEIRDSSSSSNSSSNNSLSHANIYRYYRNRLRKVFMPKHEEIYGSAADSGSNNLLLKDTCKYSNAQTGNGILSTNNYPGPYHLINANVVLPDSKDTKVRKRSGDSFVLSPAYCGSAATGWCDTSKYIKGELTLATAMSISGSALSPNTGTESSSLTRNRMLSFLMAILNLRLGSWVENTNPKLRAKLIKFPNHFYPSFCYGLGSLFTFKGGGYREDRSFIQLSDGGHFDNLGLYELLRRRLDVIVVSDASADPSFSFTDLRRVLRIAESDFQLEVKFDDDSPLSIVTPGSGEGNSPRLQVAERGYLTAKIFYKSGTNGNVEKTGQLFYIKSTMVSMENIQTKSYKIQYPNFPDQPTIDQFFDETQFVAYRDLGNTIAEVMLNDTKIGGVLNRRQEDRRVKGNERRKTADGEISLPAGVLSDRRLTEERRSGLDRRT